MKTPGHGGLGAAALALAAFVANSGTGAEAATCRVWTDPQGVHHVWAGSSGAGVTAACFGYVHGRYRVFQMDWMRRLMQGRKAELVGWEAARADFVMRLMGLPERAAAIWKDMDAPNRAALRSYARGVNAGFGEAKRAGVYELDELGYEPEPWWPEHTIGLVLLQAFDQTRKSFEHDREDERALQDLGAEAGPLLSADGLPWDATVLKPGEFPVGKRDLGNSFAGARPEAARARLELAGLFDAALGSPGGGGSNNWVLAPARSASGRAWLANDPHLTLRHPPFWHWVHVKGDSVDVIGASLPGIPTVASGSNRRVAWGVTNSYLDVGDLFYVPESDLLDAVKTRPWIWIRVAGLKLPAFFKTFRRTREGWPVLPIEAPPGRAAVLRWTGFDVRPSDFSALANVVEAKSAGEMDRILSAVGIPSWNFVFADVAGGIGYRAVGRVPKRTSAGEVGIPDATLDEIRGVEYLDPSEMPAAMQPARGWVATANNRHWPVGSKFNGGRAYADGFRAYRIEEGLIARSRHDLESQRKIQCDVQAVDARFLLPLMLEALGDRKSESALGSGSEESLGWIEDWGRAGAADGYLAARECRACPIYLRWADRLKEATGLGEGPLYRLLRAQPKQEIVSKAVATSWRDALLDWRRAFGGRFPSWGDVHRNFFGHLLGDAYFLAEGIATPGDDHSVNPGSLQWRESFYEHQKGASHRLLVELTNPPTVHARLSGPNEDVADRHLEASGSPWRRWADCEYDRRMFPLDDPPAGARTIEI